MSDTNERGSGKTTNQMINAPVGSAFVWCNADTIYPKRLADQLGRNDLFIFGNYVLSNESLRGRRFPALIIDHALGLSSKQYEDLVERLLCVKPH